MKKRVWLHIVFWLFYVTNDGAMEFAWLRSYFPSMGVLSLAWLSLRTAATLLPGKMLLSYFLIWFVIDKGIARNKPLPGLILLSIPVYMASILLHRVILRYYTVPILLNNAWKDLTLLELRRVLSSLLDIGYAASFAVAMKLLRMHWGGKEREKKLVQEKLEAELKFLRTQTNPHFLFNTLNNIYALARKKSDDTADVVMKLSKLLRFMLYESKKERIPVSGEIRMIEDYLELEKIRYNERLTIKLEKDIDDASQFIAPLLLLPFIENAFKHGASETRFDSYIHINIHLKGGILNFCIENSKEVNGNTTVTDNIGLSNVRRQLELMYAEHSLQVDNQKDSFKIHLTINLNNDAALSLHYY
jgi:two-component system LytT family sensor kinase